MNVADEGLESEELLGDVLELDGLGLGSETFDDVVDFVLDFIDVAARKRVYLEIADFII